MTGTDPRRVVVTGLGATTPVGGDLATTWKALLAGASGVSALSEEWAADLPVRFAARAAVDPAGVLPVHERRRMDRVQQFALVAAREAWADAGAPDVAPERLAVTVSSGAGGVGSLLAEHDTLRERGWKRVSPLTVPRFMANGPAAWLSLEFGAAAELHSSASACASGADGILVGLELIRSGRADVVIAGGTEAMIHPVIIAGFAAMRALSPRNDDPEAACRPFDVDRDGFVLGEGAGVLVLESAEHAARRGATVHAELAGAGRSADAHHIANPDPAGSGAIRAMRRALADAHADPSEVVHVNGHATGTPSGDAAEATAVTTVLGPALDHATVTSTKSATGHLLGAGGAVEAIATVLTLRDGLAPPTVNCDRPDPALGAALTRAVVRGGPRELPVGPAAALSNSFAFGGQNVSLLLRRSGGTR